MAGYLGHQRLTEFWMNFKFPKQVPSLQGMLCGQIFMVNILILCIPTLSLKSSLSEVNQIISVTCNQNNPSKTGIDSRNQIWEIYLKKKAEGIWWPFFNHYWSFSKARTIGREVATTFYNKPHRNKSETRGFKPFRISISSKIKEAID